MNDEEDVPDELVTEKVADYLLAVADLANGDFSVRVDSSFPDDHPLRHLAEGINGMVASLEAARQHSAATQAELEAKLATIEAQRLAIRELSTPIIEVWEGVLCLPVVGVVDTVRSAEMTEKLLLAVLEKKAWCAIIDITGIQVMDTGTADHFLRMAKAVRLLGAKCLVTGINPAIAQTIVHMGVDLSDVTPHRSLRSGLSHLIESMREESSASGGATNLA